MNDRIELSLSPTGGNVAGSIRVTPEQIAYHLANARRLRAQAMLDVVAWLKATLFGAAARRRAAIDCADAAWLAR